MIFDGKSFARKIIEDLKKQNTKKKLVVIYNPEHNPSRIYTNLKEKVAQELDVEFIKIPISEYPGLDNYNDADGILVQVPLGNPDLESEIIGLIDLKKDVDGLRENSPYLPAAARAVVEILRSNTQDLGSICIVGSKGFVGRKLMQVFPQAFGMDKEDFDPTSPRLRGASIIISATGIPGLITDVQEGAICIDVGYPDPEFTPGALLRASFYTPVPGGVGPVTVAMLFANLILL